MNPNIIYVRALDCSKSPHNVRTQSDADADAELEANIGESGIVLQNLIGVAVPRKKGHFSIFGGGRRLERIHNLIAKGVFGEDFMVPVLPVKNARDAIEMSMAENYFNLAMNPADECRGFQAIIEREKKTPADVAKRFGKTERFVLGRLRLADLAEPVFDALRTGEITIDVATAYAHTSDTDRQAKVFAQMSQGYYRHNANEIRRAVESGSYKGGDPKAMLVGRDAYLAAGGTIDADLYTDATTELWRDGDIVDKLVDEVLARSAAELREREGFAEVRTVSATSIPYSETFQLGRLDGEPVPLAPEAKARKVEIEAELAEIEKVAEEADGYTEEQEARIETLEEEIGGILDTGVALSDDQKSSAIAYLLIGPDGEPRLYEQLFVAESEDPEEVDEGEDADGDGDADPDASDPDGEPADAPQSETYSQKLKDELAMMKTELLALHVASDPHFALDLGTFIMVDDACHMGWSGMPSELRAKAPSPRVSGFKSETPAAQALAKLDEGLDRSWLDHKEIEERYDAFCALDDAARAAWLGWAVARTLHAVPDGMTGSGFLNHLGAKLRIDVKAWWRPTARNFFDRITKPAILGLFEAIGGSELKSRYAASRKFDLAASAEKLFAGQIIAEAEAKERAVAWLPGPMRFAAEDPGDASLFEAADASADLAQPEPVAEPETGQRGEEVEQDREEPVELPEAA
jgi:ParB family chromosome partitioning protein